MPRLKASKACARCAGLEGIIALQNGGFDEIARIIEEMPGGTIAKIVAVLERHGTRVNRPQKPLQ